MCDMEKITREKNELLYSIGKTLTVSGANMVTIKAELITIERKANENIRALSLLL